MTNSIQTQSAEKQPIPPDFFANIHNHDPDKELSYSLHRQKLQAALSMPANNRWVADWIFLDMHSPFHRNITVPPEAFENSLSIQVMHHFFDVDTPTCPFKRIRDPSAVSMPTSRFHTKGADMLLLPVASTNGITVGYSFGAVRDSIPSQSRNVVFCGRFAFESAREDLLVVSNGDQPGVPQHAEKLMVIMSFMWSPNAVREHYMILCPLRDYSYYNLPNEVYFFTSAEMHIPSQRPVPMDIQALQKLFQNDNAPDIVDELLQVSPSTGLAPQSTTPSFEEFADLFELPSASSDFPWFLDSKGKPQDNVGIPRRPGSIATSSGAFNMDALSASLSAIEESLRGDFYGSRQGADFMHSEAHPVKTPNMPNARNVVARISRADSSQSTRLRQFAISLYLRHVLPIISDDRFITHGEQIGLLPAFDSAKTHMNGAPDKKMRRIAPLPVVSSNRESEGNTDPMNEEERRKEEKREEKRRRNRLSAARSNEKRRESWQMQRRTLKALQKRVQELKEHKMALAAENEVLKGRLPAVSE